jgi:hypothetical protein
MYGMVANPGIRMGSVRMVHNVIILPELIFAVFVVIGLLSGPRGVTPKRKQYRKVNPISDTRGTLKTRV